jgi:hypothetical protein
MYMYVGILTSIYNTKFSKSKMPNGKIQIVDFKMQTSLMHILYPNLTIRSYHLTPVVEKNINAVVSVT